MFDSFYKFESRENILNIYIDNVDFENKKWLYLVRVMNKDLYILMQEQKYTYRLMV